MRFIEKVKGHCATWIIYEDRDGFYCVSGKRYGTLERAKTAIRIAEREYLRENPNAPLKNADIWADHGCLWVDDIDGGYYE